MPLSYRLNKLYLIRGIVFVCILFSLSGYSFVDGAAKTEQKAYAAIDSGSIQAEKEYKNDSQFELTQEEQYYLETLRNRPIKIAYSYDLIAAEFNGESYGMMEPVLKILRDEWGLDITLVKTNWHDAFIQVEKGEVDFYGPIAISESRRERYITVNPFYRSYSKVMTRVNDPVNSMLGIHSRAIGLLEGSVISRTMQTYLGPKGRIVYFPTMDDMIKGLEDEMIDAFATVDNAEFEIMQHDKIRFEFSIDNYYVDQGFISGREDMRQLAQLLNRYLEANPQICDEIVVLRREALLQNTRERFADEIAYLQENYEEVIFYADATSYPLCYLEDGTIKGMLLEINQIFEDFTDIDIRIVTDDDFLNEDMPMLEGIKTGECMAVVGGYYDIDTWNDPAIRYSAMIWKETLHTYSYKDIGADLVGKTIGTMWYAWDYLGWNNTTGNPPAIYKSRKELLDALKHGAIDIAFMGEMRFNYGYLVLKDYSLRELEGISAEVNMHMIYGAQNMAFNELYDEAMALFQVLNPRSVGIWKSQIDKYKSDYIRMRYTQQIGITIVIVLFAIMSIVLFYLWQRNRWAHKRTTEILEVVQEKSQIITSGIAYASKIQKNLLPKEKVFKKAFSDYSIIWEPRDVVGGDIYWLKNFGAGSVLCVCDCTGHGTPGAFLTMLVVSAFETVVNESNCNDTANIIWKLEQRLIKVLNVNKSAWTEKNEINDGCDLAVLFIAKDGSVTISNANIHVFICDGKEVTQIKAQRIYIGEGRLKSKDDVNVTTIPANPDNKFYIASDGLYDQSGGELKRPFGYKAFKQIILENHDRKQADISAKIWEEFESHRGEEARRDDFELITFEPSGDGLAFFTTDVVIGEEN